MRDIGWPPTRLWLSHVCNRLVVRVANADCRYFLRRNWNSVVVVSFMEAWTLLRLPDTSNYCGQLQAWFELNRKNKLQADMLAREPPIPALDIKGGYASYRR